MPRAYRRAHRVEEPGRQEYAVVRQEALELAVEDVRDAVIARMTARAAVGLHQRLRGLEGVPARVARLTRGRPGIAEIRVRQLRHHLESQEIVRKIDALPERG